MDSSGPRAVAAHLTPTAATLTRLHAVAGGDAPADLAVRGARVMALTSGEILERDVLVADGFVAALVPAGHGRAARDLEADGRYLAPTFIDTHLHIEYTMLTPGEFARCVVPRGTGCVLADPNCIGNVLGTVGMDWAGRTGTPLKILQQISHRIPRSPDLELGGAVVEEDEQLARIVGAHAVTVGESMPYGLDARAARLHAAALAAGRRLTGHTARVDGEALWAYLATGISDDHNAFETREILERIRLGLMITVMAGSMNDNLPSAFADLPALEDCLDMIAFCADDRHVEDLVDEGHIDHHVRQAIALGVPPIAAYRMASLNAARYYGFAHVLGSITPTRRADFMLLDDLTTVRPALVVIDGEIAAEDGVAIFENVDVVPDACYGTMRLGALPGPEAFRVASTAPDAITATVRAMEMYDGYFKRAFEAELSVSEGDVLPDTGSDIAKISVLDRHHASGAIATGFVRGFGLDAGALAATTNCENQNLVVVGTSNEEMAAAVSALAAMGGGYVAVREGRVLASVPLPVAGIMSDAPFEQVRAASIEVNAAARSLGCTLDSPFMILAFVGLFGIPDYGLTERGLIDSATQSFVPVVLCCRCPAHVHANPTAPVPDRT